ncbi:hypothetical protein EVAR_56031_1 [Eumeta japonica]|uniref:Uncharacterized protein n=1 Tax=Eumeta variegata TaxID=151549 RepID=A0A4C1YND5_EUMVA|nr:hypothetical protein EVAR_56031_1 [Eumeta japonica]
MRRPKTNPRLSRYRCGHYQTRRSARSPQSNCANRGFKLKTLKLPTEIAFKEPRTSAITINRSRSARTAFVNSIVRVRPDDAAAMGGSRDNHDQKSSRRESLCIPPSVINGPSVSGETPRRRERRAPRRRPRDDLFYRPLDLPRD